MLYQGHWKHSYAGWVELVKNTGQIFFTPIFPIFIPHEAPQAFHIYNIGPISMPRIGGIFLKFSLLSPA